MRGRSVATPPALRGARSKNRDTRPSYRVRVRMYRHGLGDCFLLTMPRKNHDAFQVLIDCGALARDRTFMTQLVGEIRDTIRAEQGRAKARLDVIVATHEHRDHISGFNQARALFDNDIEIGSVWMSWAENLTDNEITRIKDTRVKAVSRLRAAAGSRAAQLAPEVLGAVERLLAFSEPDASAGTGTTAEALEYLKQRGRAAGDLRYLEPGTAPISLPGVEDVRVYVLGPPYDPVVLKSSSVTERMKREGLVYHLSMAGEVAMDALCAGLDDAQAPEAMRHQPFGPEHRIARPSPSASSPHFAALKGFLATTYDAPGQGWRRIEAAWLDGFEQLALALDNDTNNTSLVLAFEVGTSGDVLLFAADAQIGSWRSWPNITFVIPGQEKAVTGADLLAHTVFYKVGHHGSHNATMRDGGLEAMNKDNLVAFIPLDQQTAKAQGTKGWEMPAAPLLKALKDKTNERVVLSDTQENPSRAATTAGVTATNTYIDYYYR